MRVCVCVCVCVCTLVCNVLDGEGGRYEALFKTK